MSLKAHCVMSKSPETGIILQGFFFLSQQFSKTFFFTCDEKKPLHSWLSNLETLKFLDIQYST
jgi:hypothetical protein